MHDISSYLQDYKIINDSIHGSICLSRLATQIVDTPEFQRLRYIKQLSTCYFVFPNAVHTRFEHSIGTYHICKKMLYNLKKNSKKEEINNIKDIPELQNRFKYKNDTDYLDDFIIELVCIGALCHDLGHGPFSHLFDDNFVQKKTNIIEENKYHEIRSCKLLEKIIKSNPFLDNLFFDSEIKFIANIINPNPNIHKSYIYQIVSNSLNSIDVDKFDYLTRDSKMLNINISFDYIRLINNSMVINNTICYPKKIDSDIVNMFQTRHYMHKKVYTHKIVVSSLLLITELLDILDSIINFSDSVDNLDEFIKYTDDYIINFAKFIINNKLNIDIDIDKINNLENILNKIDNHSFYTMVYYNYIDCSNTTDKFYNFKQDICDDNDLVLFESVIGFISGKKKNPLESVYLYQSKNPYQNLEILTNTNVERLLPNKYQEKILIIFYKHKNNFEIVEKLKNFFIPS